MPGPARQIALINQKGGVGKTTTTANLGAALARRGRRVLLIDCDPQSHLTMHLGVEPSGEGGGSIYEVLADARPLSEVIRPTAVEGVRLVPATIDLAAAEVELVGVVGREVLLRDALTALGDPLPFDYVLLDCPPSLGLLTLNALSAASEVLICLQPHFLALQGVGKLLQTVALVQQRLNPALSVSGVVLCMYEQGTRLAGEVSDDLSRFLADHRDRRTPWSSARVFDTIVRRNIKLAECPSFGQVIFQYAPTSHGAEDYARLGEEVLAMEPGESPSDHARQPALAVSPDAPESPQPDPAHLDPSPPGPPSDDALAGSPGDPDSFDPPTRADQEHRPHECQVQPAPDSPQSGDPEPQTG